jgi:hypothetical protein
MRDPKRIARILGKLQQIWERYPDMRLGQLVTNLIPGADLDKLWFIEEDELERKVDTVLAHGWNRHDNESLR